MGQKIILTREDLIPRQSFISIENVEFSDFKCESITSVEIMAAEYIIFIDGNRNKVLKNRYDIELYIPRQNNYVQ